MADRGHWTDEKLDLLLGGILRAGVGVSAFVVALGGFYYLYQYWGRPVPAYAVFDPNVLHPDYQSLDSVPDELRSISGIVTSAFHLHSRGFIQLGIVILIATPIARVVFSAWAFAAQRDYTYVTVTLIVLGVLLFSLLTGGG